MSKFDFATNETKRKNIKEKIIHCFGCKTKIMAQITDNCYIATCPNCRTTMSGNNAAGLQGDK